MRVGCGIDQQNVGAPTRLLDPIHDRAFAVGLEGLHSQSQFAPQLFQRAVDITKPRTPVNLRLTLAEQIQVGPVNDQNRRRRAPNAASSGRLRARFAPRRHPSRALNPTHPAVSSNPAAACLTIINSTPSA
jgi:hypothetical protein